MVPGRGRGRVPPAAEVEEDDDGHSCPTLGLPELVEATREVVPEGHRRALVAAQKVTVDLKVAHAPGIVVTGAAAAAAAAAVPIPFSDAFLIVPAQVGMLAGISATFGREVTQATLMTLISATFGAGGAALLGRAIVGQLIKLIPGGGSLVGGVIAAATASALTVALGEVYIQTLKTLFEKSGGEPPLAAEVEQEFKRQLALRSAG